MIDEWLEGIPNCAKVIDLDSVSINEALSETSDFYIIEQLYFQADYHQYWLLLKLFKTVYYK